MSQENVSFTYQQKPKRHILRRIQYLSVSWSTRRNAYMFSNHIIKKLPVVIVLGFLIELFAVLLTSDVFVGNLFQILTLCSSVSKLHVCKL